MSTYWVLFILGIAVALVAFLDFPFPHVIDKALLIVVGLFIAFISYALIARKRARKRAQIAKQNNSTHELHGNKTASV